MFGPAACRQVLRKKSRPIAQIPFDFAVEPSIAVHVNLASGNEFTAPQDILVRG
jgi:hypothetical protein